MDDEADIDRASELQVIDLRVINTVCSL